MTTQTDIARGLYLLARQLDIGESFTLDRGANSLTFDTSTRNFALTRRVRGLAGDPMFFAGQVLREGTLIQHQRVAALARWLEVDTRLYVTREPEGLGLVLSRVSSGARTEAAVSDEQIVADPGAWGPPGPKLGQVLQSLRRDLGRLE